MPRLIDAVELIEVAHRERLDSRERIERMIESAPTVDAEPVRYGKWLDADDGIGCTCSICGYDAWADTPFCPNCGARMDESKEQSKGETKEREEDG